MQISLDDLVKLTKALAPTVKKLAEEIRQNL
jgi:hypothetical protein